MELALASVLWALARAAPEVDVPPPPLPADYRLVVRAPPECPDADSIRRQVRTLLSGPPLGEGVMDVEAIIELREPGYALTLTTSFAGAQGQRALAAERCSELADAIAIVVAVALEPGVEPVVIQDAPAIAPPREPDPPEPDPPDPEVVAQPEPEPEPEPEPAPERAQPRPFLRLGLGPEHGALPRVTAGLHAAAGVVWPHVRLELRAIYLAPQRHAGPAPLVALYQQGAVGAAACARAWLLRTEVPLCGGVEAGALRIDSRGLSPSQTLHGGWFGPLLSAGFARHGPRWGGWISADAVLRAVGARILVDDRAAFSSGLVSLRLVAGVEIFLQ